MPVTDPHELGTVSRQHLRLSRKLAADPWEMDEKPCCASCGEPVDETGIDFDVDVVFCKECSTFEYDENYCDLGGEG